MDPLVEYTIPIQGIGIGVHHYDYHINGHFFSQFEYAPVQEAKIQLSMVLEKKHGLYILDFDFSGTVKSICDRCLADIDLPIKGRNRLLVKLGADKESDDPEVVYIDPDAQQLHVAEYIYEFLILAIPMIKVYNCEKEEPSVCNQEMLDRLSGGSDKDAAADEEVINPIWEELKKFNSNK